MPARALTHDTVDAGRRRFLRGRLRAKPPPVRPPWARDAFTDLCTRCGSCAEACPEGIVIAGEGGFPEVDFGRGGCTFCAACAVACPVGAFDARSGIPWRHKIAIGDACLTARGVVCRSCRDICPERAVSFAFGLSGVTEPRLRLDACTGCGACISVCPTSAIDIHVTPEAGHGR